MKNLRDLMAQTDCELVQGNADIAISDIVYDSRKVTDGCLFVCLKGAVSDGHRFAGDAAAKGAAAILVQDKVEVPEHVAV